MKKNHSKNLMETYGIPDVPVVKQKKKSQTEKSNTTPMVLSPMSREKDESPLKIRFFTFEQYHNKKDVGSTRIRVHNLIDKWPEAELYQYGDDMDVMIFQKVYMTQDYKYLKNLNATKILDLCDPDWFQNTMIKESVDAVDAVTTSTKALADFIKQMTDKPVVHIKDRFKVEDYKPKDIHNTLVKNIFWFGYAHNAVTLRFVMPVLQSLGLNLTVMANEDPSPWRWAHNENYKKKYKYLKFSQSKLNHEIQKADAVVFPVGNRPEDKFKSENKTIIAQLNGIPVAKTREELEELMSSKPKQREELAKAQYDKIKVEYDCRKSVTQYKKLISQLRG